MVAVEMVVLPGMRTMMKTRIESRKCNWEKMTKLTGIDDRLQQTTV